MFAILYMEKIFFYFELEMTPEATHPAFHNRRLCDFPEKPPFVESP